MDTVGLRELKGNLSRYMKRVKDGERIVVTDRKQRIAVIMPVSVEPYDAKLFGMVKRGLAVWSGGKPKGMAVRVRTNGKSVSEAVVEDRR